MTLNDWSASLAGLAPALGNHLWQSTIFLVAAGLLTLSLRKNPARARYWLWLAASVKFLIPFSLLITVGSHLWHGSARTNAGFYHAIDAVGQPFPLPLLPETSGAYPSTVLPRATPVVPILLAVWLCGFLVILSVWLVRWRRISAIVRTASPIRDGREVEALRRLAAVGGARQRIKILLSRASLEPGIFGIARPVLLWPEGLSDRLGDAHLEAILAHELWHVQRRDNLAAAVHMLVEATFWFHPLVWWLGARIVEERERACDEEVLEMGSERQVYAESILKICEFCVESPLACVSGVTGSDLKKRVVHIMTKNISRKLDFSRKLLLSVSALLAVAAPVMFGLVNAPQGRSQSPKTADALLASFDAASVKLNRTGDIRYSVSLHDPRRFTATNITTKMLIQFAYNVRDFQLSGGPDWINSERYDIDAKIRDSLVDEERNLSFFQRQDLVRPMLQSLLSDRFGLNVIHETNQLPIYALVVAKSGLKLSQTSLTPSGSPTASPRASTLHPTGMSVFTLVGPLSAFGDALSRLPELGRVVLDQTGLKGNYDFLLQWTPADPTELPTGGDGHGSANARPSDTSGPSIFTAIQEQLGLKLESREGPVQVLVIDHVERPAEAQAQDTLPAVPAFESAMIKPNNGEPMAGFMIVGKPFKAITWKGDRLMATNFTLHGLIRVAYGVPDDQILGGPDWLTTEGYDLDAKMEKSVADEMRKRGPRYGLSGRTLMFQKLLSDRFKLSFHRETRDIPVYALVVATNGPKLHPAKPDDTYANGLKKSDGSPLGANILSAEEGKLIGQGIPVAKLVEDLSAEYYLHRTVLDKTGLAGRYDFTLQWTPEQNQSAILAAIQQQLGLRVEPQTAPVEVLVIDQAEKPAEN